MKKAFTTVALFAVLGTMAVSCQKENEFDRISVEAEQNAIYRVNYAVDGKTYHLTLIGDVAWHDFLNRMFALAEEGHIITFRIDNPSTQITSSKEVLTYTTTNHDDAYSWAEKKVNEGYEVTIKFNERTGEYTCTAVK